LIVTQLAYVKIDYVSQHLKATLSTYREHSLSWYHSIC